ncbi:short-chain dehydrogenase [Achromobacter aloeverae]|uniref:Short-chain dehydrogenase n=2 Tax=Achromobacter aloeverae TaxID=1750518 RepID=A0A4Q1HP27_9BURK|nr:short-chain dehydrogenase [Achromobacter aloeverae]
MALMRDKVVVITGGSRGIGLAAARLFAAQGASLALCARGEEKLREAARMLGETYAVPVLPHAADILDTASVQAFVHAVASRYGHIDALVNNAGASSQREADGVNWPVNAVDAVSQPLPPGRFEAISDAEWRAALEQKLLGMARVVRAALPALRAAQGASIVNVTSIKGRQPPPRVVTSGVAWAAAMNLSKALSLELAQDAIRVNVVSVGGILTPQMEAGRARWAPGKTLEEFLAPRVANIPLKRLGSMDEVAQAIFFLASPLSSYITGQCLAVDGGGLRSI